MPVGPIEPATKRGLLGVLNSSAAARASCAAAQVDLVRAVAQLIVVQLEARAGEGVGLQHVGARGEVGAVDLADGVGPGDDEDFGAAIVLRAAVVVGRQRQVQDLGAHRAVVDQDTAARFVEIPALYWHGATSSGTGIWTRGAGMGAGKRIPYCTCFRALML